MPDWLARLRREFAAIASAPTVFTVVVLCLVAGIWGAVQWSYGALLSGKNAEIRLLERRLAEWRDKMAGMSADEVRDRLRTLETQARSLQMRLHPRVLGDDMRQALIDRARLRGGLQYSLTVLREDACSDCEQFGEQIVAALRESASWSVSVGVLPETAEKPRYGLAIRVADPLRPPPEAARLQAAMQSAGIAFEMVGGGGTGTELLVTERPVQ
jgi:hypothetical protein